MKREVSPKRTLTLDESSDDSNHYTHLDVLSVELELQLVKSETGPIHIS